MAQAYQYKASPDFNSMGLGKISALISGIADEMEEPPSAQPCSQKEVQELHPNKSPPQNSKKDGTLHKVCAFNENDNDKDNANEETQLHTFEVPPRQLNSCALRCE